MNWIENMNLADFGSYGCSAALNEKHEKLKISNPAQNDWLHQPREPARQWKDSAAANSLRAS